MKNRWSSMLFLSCTAVAISVSAVTEVYRGANVVGGQETPVAIERFRSCYKGTKAEIKDGEWRFDNGTDAKGMNGSTFQLNLNQKMAQSFAVSVESMFLDGPEETPSSSYSLYLDVTHKDGTKVHGLTHCFRNVKSVWQRGCVALDPDKPVKHVCCYLLFRNRAGAAAFRKPAVTIYQDVGFARFDYTRILPVPGDIARPMFLVHDAALDGDGWTALADGESAKGVSLKLKREQRAGAEFFDVSLEETTGRDRAFTFAYSIPLPDGELTWLDTPRREIKMEKSGQYRNTVNVGCGEGALSRWPFGAVKAGGEIFAIGYDSSAPAVFRVTANAELRRLFIAFDVGFAKEKQNAHFRFTVFKSAAEEGFRGALAKYAEIFPEAFKVRIKKHGIWMAFRPISKVEGWEDFGFRAKEGDGEPDWDDAHDMLTFHYTEPTSWWMTMKTTNAVTMADATAAAEQYAAGNPKYYRGLARAWKACTYHDLDGKVTGKLCDRPWCKGACWNLNPLPDIPGGDYQTKLSANDFAKRYAKPFPGGVDGEYIDSAECHLPPRIDFNRANFRYSRTPLCFDKVSRQTGVSTALAIYEYVSDVANRVHADGRLMQANGAPYTWPWLIPFVDYGGQETKWIVKGEGEWLPMSDEDLLYRMALAYGKPYCFLMNVNFTKFTDEMVEKYFQRCLAYGLMSSFFSHNASEGHYFSRPEIYNRHRRFFKKYGPLQRKVSEAGWRPVNRLVAANGGEKVFVEQFGDRLVTVYNSSTNSVKVKLEALSSYTQAKELVVGGELKLPCEIELPGETVKVLEMSR